MSTKLWTTLLTLSLLLGCQGQENLEPAPSTLYDEEGQVSSVPNADAECTTLAKSLQTPKNAGGVMFDEDCTTVFVLPPIKGEVKVAALAKNQNLGFCSAFRDGQGAQATTMASAKTLAERIAAAIAGNASLEDEVEEAGKALAISKAEYQSAKEIYESAESTKSELVTAVGQARSALTSCQALGDDCGSEAQAVAESRSSLRAFLADDFTAKEQAFYDKKLENERNQNEYNRLMSGWTEFVTPLLALQQQLFALNASVANLLSEYTKLEGATGQLIYTIPWDTLIRDFKELNPNTRFSKLRVIDGHFDATSKSLDGLNLTSVPALLWSQIPGISHRHGVAVPPDGTAPVQPLADGSEEPLPGIAAFNGTAHSISAQIGLSLAGACPYYPAGVDSENPDQIDAQNLAAHVVMNAMLTYEVKANRKYSAEYHLSNMIRKVERRSRQGGFFSTRAVNSVASDGNSSDWFKIEFDETASGFGYTPEEKTKITAEVKQTLISRAMKNLATATGVAAAPPEVPEFVKPGTRRIARKLRRCHWYGCRSAWVISTVAASVSNRSAVSEFHQRNNVWSRETVDQNAVIPRTVLVSFDPSLNDTED